MPVSELKTSPALLDALREHMSATELEGQVKARTPEQRGRLDKYLS
jgi:hypothetical protein